MKTTRLLTLVGGLSVAGIPAAYSQTQFFQAPTGPSGEWNVYQLEFTGQSFAAANAAANANVQDFGTGPINGHLVSIGSQAENDMIWRWGDRGNIWIGLSDREGVAPGAEESQTLANNRTMGWAWTDGSSYTFQAWGGGEPNDWAGAEDAAHLRDDGLWNDNGSGFGADAPQVPTIQPGTSLAEPAPAFKFATEWNTNSAAPLANVRTANIFDDLGGAASLPGPAGGAGSWGVREIRDLGVGNIYDAVDAVRGGGGTITDGSFAVLDTSDPDTNGAPAGSVGGFANAFLTDQAGVDDNNIITVAKATIDVTDAGTYTFQMRSDDGFALRIPGQNWTSVNGPAQAGIDPMDPETMFFRNGTGDSNTRGTIDLPAGQHAIELITWEGGGGAFYELSSTKGAVAGSNEANWILVGDTTTTFGLEAIIDPATLTGDVTVHKVDQNAGDPGLANTIATTDAAVAGGTQSFVSTHPDTLFGEGEIDGADDNYMLRVDGSFTIDDGDATMGELLDLTFTLRTDDGSALRILGEDFVSVGGDARAALLDIGGDAALAADFYTGNTNVFGHISLTEGVTYDFNSYMFEGGGGSRFELQAALGTVSNLGDATFFVLDQSVSNIFRPANEGLALVPEPGSGLLALLGAALLLRRRRR